jgi:NitT/TauT family transport system ATP-binding protein
VLVMTRRPGVIKAEIEVSRHAPGGRDWETFTADPSMQAICEQVLKLVRAERGLTGKPSGPLPGGNEVVA